MASSRWIRLGVYPLLAATGVAVGICGIQLIRNITGNPEVWVLKEKRAARVLDNFAEAAGYPTEIVAGYPVDLVTGYLSDTVAGYPIEIRDRILSRAPRWNILRVIGIAGLCWCYSEEGEVPSDLNTAILLGLESGFYFYLKDFSTSSVSCLVKYHSWEGNPS
ncbi:hypothetical protein LWI28_015110 [Acer negundo]|uniref:Uncharacterized protein n=1 Tax=Acer negundo TaxID=4023 RepID=A0AAD5NEV9_ACENE|nr:hypothetical protein LWI28_015110 [Acer negundo]